jgi:iron complex transport system permease protein
VHVRRTRLLAGCSITLLAGAATAAMGPVAFLGLVAAIAARRLVGSDHRWVLPTAMLAGAIVLLVSDIVGRVLVRPAELEVGVVMALIGGPVLIAAVRRGRRPADAPA